MNKSQNHSAQNATEQTIPQLKPDFSHRLSIVFGDEAKPASVSDAVNILASQADSLLALIGSHFIGDEERNCAVSDDVIVQSIEAVRHTVMDIKAIVAAYHQAVNEANTKNQQA